MPFRDIALLNDNSARQYGSIGGAAGSLTQAGDKLLICAVQSSGVNTFTITSSGPTAPTLRRGPDAINANETVYLWSLTVAAGDVGATYTISAPSGGWFVGAIVTFSNATSAAPIVGFASDTDGNTSATSPTITTTADNSDVATFWVARAASGTVPVVTLPGTQTLAGVANTKDSASPNFALAVGYRTTPGAAGTYGGTTATFNEAVTGVVMYTVGLTPTATTADPGFDVFAVAADGSMVQYSAYYVDAAGALQQVADRTK
jgi:hypothetical protein